MTTEAQLREALQDAQYTLEYIQPFVQKMGVPPYARKIGIISGQATSGAHKITAAIKQAKAALSLPSQRPDDEGVDTKEYEALMRAVHGAIWNELKIRREHYIGLTTEELDRAAKAVITVISRDFRSYFRRTTMELENVCKVSRKLSGYDWDHMTCREKENWRNMVKVVLDAVGVQYVK